MVQGELFKDQNEVDIESLNLSEAVDLSTFDVRLFPGMYYIFKTGGYHYLSKCKQQVPEIYRQPIWPFVLRNMRHPLAPDDEKRHSEKAILWPSIGLTQNGYQKIFLLWKDKTRVQTIYKKDGTTYTKIVPKGILSSFSRIIAKAFVPNPNPEEFILVDHVDGNRINDRPKNLRWTKQALNANGTPGGKNDPDEVFDNIKDTDWFNGRGTNNLNIVKKTFQENQQRQQISFTFNADFIKGMNNE